MRHLGFALLAALVAFVSIAHPKAVRADTVCYISGAPTPAPIGNVRITFPSCSIMGGQNILNVSPVGPDGTPVAVPTDTAGIPYTHPTSLPTAYPGFQNSTGPVLPIACNKSTPVNVTAAGETTIIPFTGTTLIYVCGFNLELVGATSTTLQFVNGFSTNCFAAPTSLTGTYQTATTNEFIAAGDGIGSLFNAAVGENLCLNVGGSTPNVQGYITWTQF